MFNDTVIEAVRGFRGDLLDLVPLGLGSHPTGTPVERRQAIDAILRGVKYQPEQRRAELVEAVATAASVPPGSDLMMTSEQAAGLARAGFELGGHTVIHPILARLTPEAARNEIERGRARVEQLAGRRIGLFAYPNGQPGRDYNAECVKLVRELGFDGAVSTSRGAARVGSDPFQVPRFTPWDRQHWRFGLRLALNLRRENYACV
jgi:peptidoglycan/xylan/chitin deacetylase (PgdA/CDA1 family)